MEGMQVLAYGLVRVVLNSPYELQIANVGPYEKIPLRRSNVRNGQAHSLIDLL